VLKDKKVVKILIFITEYFSRICGYCTISQSREPIVDYYKMDQVQESKSLQVAAKSQIKKHAH
jgi:pyruvate formate-lyase activating enzyme-like uncharacterized protein